MNNFAVHLKNLFILSDYLERSQQAFSFIIFLLLILKVSMILEFIDWLLASALLSPLSP